MKQKSILKSILFIFPFLLLSCDNGYWKDGDYDFEIHTNVEENTFIGWKTLDIRDIKGYNDIREDIKDLKILDSFVILKSEQFPKLEITELKLEARGIASYTQKSGIINSRLKIDNLDYLEFITKVAKALAKAEDGKIDLIVTGKTAINEVKDAKISLEFYNKLSLHVDE